MASTLNEAEAERQRLAAIELLKQDRAKKAAALAEVDAKLAEVEQADFMQRLGDRRRSQMSNREKIETIRRIGSERYLALDW
jgi:hypothetical protein